MGISAVRSSLRQTVTEYLNLRLRCTVLKTKRKSTSALDGLRDLGIACLLYWIYVTVDSTSPLFLFCEIDKFLLYVFREASDRCPDINMICLSSSPASFVAAIAGNNVE